MGQHSLFQPILQWVPRCTATPLVCRLTLLQRSLLAAAILSSACPSRCLLVTLVDRIETARLSKIFTTTFTARRYATHYSHEAHSPQYCVSLVRGEVGLTLSQGAATVTSATTAINDIIDISMSTMSTIYRIYVAHLAATERRWAICFGDVFSPPALREAQARRAYIYLLIFVYFLYY